MEGDERINLYTFVNAIPRHSTPEELARKVHEATQHAHEENINVPEPSSKITQPTGTIDDLPHDRNTVYVRTVEDFAVLTREAFQQTGGNMQNVDAFIRDAEIIAQSQKGKGVTDILYGVSFVLVRPDANSDQFLWGVDSVVYGVHRETLLQNYARTRTTTERGSDRPQLTVQMARDLYRPGAWDEVAEGYKVKLREDPQFIHTLLELFRIGSALDQSYFFRDSKKFKVLKDTILPTFGPDRTIHATSIGTSKGMDVLSLLMNVWDLRDRFEITGVDVNPISLQAAINGRYNNRYDIHGRKHPSILAKTPLIDIATHVPKRIRDAVFHTEKTSEGKEIVVNEQARRHLRFDEWDILLQGPLPERQEIILFENIGMYFSPLGRAQALLNIRDSLTEDGWLICEPMSTMSNYPKYDKWMADLRWLGFERIDSKGPLRGGQKIYRVIPDSEMTAQARTAEPTDNI